MKALISGKKVLNWNQADENATTPVHIAAEVGNQECFNLIVTKMGGDVNVQNSAGLGIAHILAKGGHANLFGIISNAGAKLDATDEKGARPLHYGAEAGNVPVIEALLKQMADVSSPDDAGDLAIHYAAQGGNFEAIDTLVQRGADLNAKGAGGQTVVHIAVEKKNIELISQLAKKGADINGRMILVKHHCILLLRWMIFPSLITSLVLLLVLEMVQKKELPHFTLHVLVVLLRLLML